MDQKKPTFEVCTLAIGKCGYRWTKNRMKALASELDGNFFSWEEGNGEYPGAHWHKCDILSRFVWESKADYLVYFDLDCHILHPRNLAGIIQETVKSGADIYLRRDDLMHTQEEPNWFWSTFCHWSRLHFSRLDLGERMNDPTLNYFNTGVWILSRKGAESWLKVIRPPWVEGFAEQHSWNHFLWEAMEVDEVKVEKLPIDLNRFTSQGEGVTEETQVAHYVATWGKGQLVDDYGADAELRKCEDRNFLWRTALTIGVERMLEIGCQGGINASTYLRELPPNLEFFSVDPYTEHEGFIDAAACPQSVHDSWLKDARERLEPYGDRWKLIKELSDDAVDQFEDESLDMIYVDGDHSEEQTYRDCENYWPKLRKGGLFCVHDYWDDYKFLQNGIGVKHAVDRFFPQSDKDRRHIVPATDIPPTWCVIKE